MRPGVNINVVDAAPARSGPEGIDMFFVAGVTEKGPLTPTLIRNMTSFRRYYGERTSYSDMYNYLDTFFREGGSRATVLRAVGPAPVTATAELDDDAAAPTIDVNATSPGAWGNDLAVTVIGDPGVSIVVQVKNGAGDLLEVTPSFASKAEMLEWSGGTYVTFADANDMITNLPDAVVGVPLTLGDDDRANIVTNTWVTLLDKFVKALGPGQIAIPGQTDSTVQAALLSHAALNDRFVLMDAPRSAIATTLTAASGTIRSDVNSRYGAMFGPYQFVPGLVPGTEVAMPYSVIQAGLEARNSGNFDPAAGENGRSRTSIRPEFEYTDSEREELNEAGVNIARMVNGSVQTYGYRTLVDNVLLPEWVGINSVRTILAIKSDAGFVGDRHMFKNIDGRGISISAFHGDLVSVLSQYWNANALYGATPDEAFAVDTGNQVNTPETIANRELNANLMVRTSPFGEMVNIQITKVPLPVTGANPSLEI